MNLYLVLGVMGSDRKQNIQRLKEYVKNSEYMEISEQPKVCKTFSLEYLPSIFRNEYRQRFYNYLLEHTTTAATVEEVTKIPHKYLCQCKDYYEKIGLLKVVYKDYCPTTNSKEVQFLSTNAECWGSIKKETNQIYLF